MFALVCSRQEWKCIKRDRKKSIQYPSTCILHQTQPLFHSCLVCSFSRGGGGGSRADSGFNLDSCEKSVTFRPEVSQHTLHTKRYIFAASKPITYKMVWDSHGNNAQREWCGDGTVFCPQWHFGSLLDSDLQPSSNKASHCLSFAKAFCVWSCWPFVVSLFAGVTLPRAGSGQQLGVLPAEYELFFEAIFTETEGTQRKM